MNKTFKAKSEVWLGRATPHRLSIEDQMNVWIDNAKKHKELDPKIALGLLDGILEQAKLTIFQSLQELEKKK